MSNYFVSGVTACSALPICNFNPGTWCSGTGDTCREVSYQAECINRNEWTGSLTGPARLQQPARCAQGCCVCSTPGVCPLNPNSPTIILVTQEQCKEYC